VESETNLNSPISILFVEDDDLILELQASVLSAKFPDIMIHTAANGTLGLELFKIYLPDIVLTDINMSELSGEQMSLRIRALKPETQFIAITGKDTSEVTFEFDHYIVKPVGFEELFVAIEKCIRGITEK
jgi:YesN/AraC family two-component response regulator